MKRIRKIDVENEIMEALRLVIENNITLYNASYLYIARKHRLKLVTEGNDLKTFQKLYL